MAESNNNVQLKKKPKRTVELICLVLLLLLTTANVLYWDSRKEGYYLDELFSYTQVCNTAYLRMTTDQKDSKYLNIWHDVSWFEDFFTINDDEAFDLVGAWNTAKDNDAHPPLYFVILELFISLFFRNHFTKWSGLAANLPFFIFTLILLYCLSKKLFCNDGIPALATVLFYGISVGAVSMAVFIRMYMVLSFFAMLLLYLHCLLYENVFIKGKTTGQSTGVIIGIFFSILLGTLTQYYYYLFAFFVCAVFFICLYIRKKWASLRVYTATAISAVSVSIILCPNFMKDIFRGHRGVGTIGEALSLKGWVYNGIEYLQLTVRSLFGILGRAVVVIILLMSVILIWKYIIAKTAPCDADNRIKDRSERKHEFGANKPETKAEAKNQWETRFVILISLAMALYVASIALIAPYQELRYVAVVLPFAVLAVCYFAVLLASCVTEAKIFRGVILFVILLSVISGYRSPGVWYLFVGFNEQLQRLDTLRPDRAIVIIDKNKTFSTNIAPCLLKSSYIYQTYSDDISELSGFKKENDENIVVYIYNDDSPEIVIEEVKDILQASGASEELLTEGKHQFKMYRLFFDEQ